MDLSIIIPVYNHEKYIKQCLESIIYDLPQNTEIIIIDDGSTDNSIKIIEEIHSDKIKIFKNEKNMGCAYSLNKAMTLAKGKYIGTNNSDDFVEKGFYKQMLTVAKETDADVVCANIADYNDSTKEIVYNKIDLGNLFIEATKQKFDFKKKAIEVKADLLLGHWTASSASTKIIKKDLLKKYKYIGTKANDLTVVYPIMAEAKKVIYMPQLYMFYRQVPNSLSRRNSEIEYNSVIETIIETMKRLEKINEAHDKIEILFFNNGLSYFINVLCEIANENVRISTMKYFINQMKHYRKNIFTDMKKSKYFSTFLKQNQITEKIYDLIEEEALIDFLIKHKLDILIKNNNLLKIDNEVLKDEIDDIKKSTSWKITKPIRNLKDFINYIRRHN